MQRRHFKGTVFSLFLGSLPMATRKILSPDYESPFEVIVERFARAFIKQGRVMDLLYSAGLKSHSLRFPSWIPDWTVLSNGTLYQSSARGVSCSASRRSEPKASYNDEKKVLEIEGHHVDQVKSISHYMNVPDYLESYLEEVDQMLEGMPNASDLRWRIPIADASLPEIVSSTAIDLRTSYRALRDSFATSSKQTILEQIRKLSVVSTEAQPRDEINQPQATLSRAQNYLNALQTNLRGWRFLETRNGSFGIAPNHVQVGDQMSIFSGGGVPFLLRNEDPGLLGYRLIGECYIDGIMKGDAYRESEVKIISLY